MAISYGLPAHAAHIAAWPVRVVIVAASGLAVLAAAIFVTVIPYGRAIWDFVFVLDGAYRISLGQTPHIDFMSPVGPLILYLTWAAQALVPGGNPFVVMHALMWMLLLPILAALAPRFGKNGAFLAALGLVALVVLLPMTLDSTQLSEISYFATYNRFATGLLLLIGLWYVLPKSRADWPLLAYILVLLFFLKITAAAVALGILLVAFALRRVDARTFLLSVGAFAAALLAVQATTGLVSANLADIRSMSAINRGSAAYAVFFSGFRNWLPLALTAGIALAAIAAFWSETRREGHPLLRAVRSFGMREGFAVDAVLLVSASLFAESQNTGGYGLISAAALCFHPGFRQSRATVNALLIAALVFPVLDIAVKRTITALSREREAAPAQALDQLLPGTRVPLSTYVGSQLFSRISQEMLPLARDVEAARFFLTPDPSTNSPATQLAWATSAVEAAHVFEERGYRQLADRYTTLSFADPFTRMLRLTPATGTTIAIQVGRTIPQFTTEQARAYLANASGVFLERCEMSADGIERTFEPVLDAEFEKRPLTRCWDFYMRRGAR